MKLVIELNGNALHTIPTARIANLPTYWIVDFIKEVAYEQDCPLSDITLRLVNDEETK